MKLCHTTLHIGVVLLVFMTCINCHAKSRSKSHSVFQTEKHLGYGNVLKDSIAEIVINTKKVTCQLVAKSPTDSLRNDSICELPKELTSVAKYLFLDPANFKTNTTVYGIFRPWVSFSFEVKKKQRIYYELDFGLAKWRLLDTNMRPICTFDMKEKNHRIQYAGKDEQKILQNLYKNNLIKFENSYILKLYKEIITM